MRILGDFVAGHVNGSIRDLLFVHREVLSDLNWALITSIDSLRDLAKLRQPSVLGYNARIIGRSILTSVDDLLDAGDVGLFSGFDEVWLFGDIPSEPPPDTVWLVGPRNAEVDNIDSVISWMRSCKCDTGLGDGIGLNFVTRELARGKKLEGIFL